MRRATHASRPGEAEAASPIRGLELVVMDKTGNLRPLYEIEDEVVRIAFGFYQGRIPDITSNLRISRSSLYRKMARLGLTRAG